MCWRAVLVVARKKKIVVAVDGNRKKKIVVTDDRGRKDKTVGAVHGNRKRTSANHRSIMLMCVIMLAYSSLLFILHIAILVILWA